MLRPTYGALCSRLLLQLHFQHTTGLDKQAFVGGLV
jgi:hypothetical protein